MRKYKKAYRYFSQAQYLEIIRQMVEFDALFHGGYFDRLVIEAWYLENTHDMRACHLTGKVDDHFGTGKRTATALQALTGGAFDKALKPKGWRDLSGSFKTQMLLYGLKGDLATHRPLTVWIGQALIQKSIKTGKHLVDLLYKGMYDGLRRYLPKGTSFGLWLNIELSEKSPTAYHAHGLLFIDDKKFFADYSKERIGLVKVLMSSSGFDGTVGASNWVRFTRKDLDLGWMQYCVKQRRGPPSRFRRSRVAKIPLDIGEKLTAGSYTLNRKAREFYERSKLITHALASEEILEWEDEDWAKVVDPATI